MMWVFFTKGNRFLNDKNSKPTSQIPIEVVGQLTVILVANAFTYEALDLNEPLVYKMNVFDILVGAIVIALVHI